MTADADARAPDNVARSRVVGREPALDMDDLRELEARFDARFQAVSARFVRVDNRFAGIDLRLDETERRHTTLDQRTATRFEVMGANLDAATSRINEVSEKLAGVTQRHDQVCQRIDHLGRHILLAVAASTCLTLTLWAVTVAIWLSWRT